jgi:hypothetical protein
MVPDASYEAEFNDWYDREHIPLRMGVPGFHSAQRYLVPGTRHYLAIYEMESAFALKTPAYQDVKNKPSERTQWMLRTVGGFTRYIADQIDLQMAGINPIDALYVNAVFSTVPEKGEPEINNWLMIRRFRIVDGEPEKWTHLTLYYLADRGGLSAGIVFAKHGVRRTSKFE